MPFTLTNDLRDVFKQCFDDWLLFKQQDGNFF